MIMSYPEKTALDAAFYNEFIAPRMPKQIFDVHVHLNLPQHIPFISKQRLSQDWAFQSGLYLTADEAFSRAAMLFPNIEYALAGFPWPIRETKMEENNTYLSHLNQEGIAFPFMGTKPDWDAEKVEADLMHFCGFKPYPDFVATTKGGENSIFEFMPHHQLEVLNRYKKSVVLHLPRKNRLADKENLKELLDMRQKYPDIQIIIAHFGRSFCPAYLSEGLDYLGREADGFYFDTAAVINPAVYKIAFEQIQYQHILFGTDAPILYWHGKRTWTERGYQNYCRENYDWNRHLEGFVAEKKYTFILYEQLKSILDAMDQACFGCEEKQGVFANNARNILHI